MKYVYIVVICIIGIIFVLTGIRKWKWFAFVNRGARNLLDVLGLTTYRIVCIFLGLICFVVAIAGLFQK